MTSDRNQNPEQIARDAIDKRLAEAGWHVQELKKLDWSKGLGIAIKEYPTDTGPADYVLFIDKTAIGVIEAKRDEEAESITEVEDQTSGYANAKLKYIKNLPLPFRYEATGVITRFTDIRDPKPRSREIFSFQRPETLQKMLKEVRSLRDRVNDLPSLEKNNLRDCQFDAIKNLEQSFKNNRPRALIQMATGAGKTFTAITSVYRLLKYAKASRILFLVDTKNLGEQAEQEFMAYTPPDDNRKFTELYNVTRLKSRYIPGDSQVYISTIQRMYSILRGQELDESAEEMNPNEAGKALRQREADVSYNTDVPLEFFDFIIVDECHRSIYNLWRQVLEYFDASLIGLTATPDDRTFGFFEQNVVSEYSHNQAVIDGVNVGYDIYLIETAISQAGAHLKRHEKVYKRERLSRKKRWTQLDEALTYTAKDLDKDVVNKSQIRTIIKAFKDCVPTLFPERKETPKTLIFAKTDSHADDIIQIVRDEFGEGSEFCKKITYMAEEDPKSVLASFRNAFNPRVAVTVDMIATGTDVKPLECLLFMRDVRSRNYYTQMLGRGTRTVKEDDFKKVTPSAQTTKTHFIVLDAVGVTSSDKTDMCPLDKKKTESTKSLLRSVLMGDTSEEVFSSLASRLTRLDRIMTTEERARFDELTKGHTIHDLIQSLLATHDPDVVQGRAQDKFKLPKDTAPTEEQAGQVQVELAKVPQSMLNGPLADYIEKVKRVHEQVIDDTNIDTLQSVGPAAQVAKTEKSCE
ncbi:DEAD/DEAH box helicase family protein [Bdellovibrionota bacterium FG-2]